MAAVGPADEDDRDGARWLLAARDQRWPALQVIWADQHYTGDLEEETRDAAAPPVGRGTEPRVAGAVPAPEQRL